MFKWSAFPFIRITLFLIAGILLFEHFPALWGNYELILPILFFLILLSWFFFRKTVSYGIISLIGISYLGGLSALLADESRRPDHFIHYEAEGFIGRISSDVSERDQYDRYMFEVKEVLQDDEVKPVSGAIHLYIKKEGPIYQYGDVLMVSGEYSSVESPGNPSQFDYSRFLRNQHIHGQSFVDYKSVELLRNEPKSHILQLAYRARTYVQKQLHVYIESDRERAILSALMIGIKDDLDNDIKQSYADAGAMHVLAVSGLHVGIIYFMLLVLLKPLKENTYGRFVVAAVSLFVIWAYALITGFSPSVMRASTMFSVIILSDAFQRRANIYNSLGIAAFLLVLIDPYVVYAVGFQLSFLAVIGIVVIQPPLYRLLEFDNRVLDYIWSITCVSIAAQLATFPISTYYFNQFPTYFLLANLIVIPAALIILSGGMLMIASGLVFDVVGEGIGWLLEKIIYGINEIIGGLSYLPNTIIDWLYFDSFQVVCLYVFLGLIIYSIARYDFRTMVASAFVIVFFFGREYQRELQTFSQRRIVFYELGNQHAIDFIDGDEAVLYGSPDSEDIEYNINPFRLANGLPNAAVANDLMVSGFTSEAYELLYWGGKRVLIVKDLVDIELASPLKSDILYLSEFHEIDLAKFKTHQLLISASIPTFQAETLIEEARELNLEVHHLRDGYWELDLNEDQKNDELSPV